MLKLYLAGGATLAALAALAYARIEHGAAEKARTEAASATRQATYERAAGNIEARRSTNTRKAQSESEEGRRAIQAATDVNSALDVWERSLLIVRASGHEPVTDPDGKRPNPGG